MVIQKTVPHIDSGGFGIVTSNNVVSNNRMDKLCNGEHIKLCLIIQFCMTASLVCWSEFLATDRYRVRFPALPDFMRSSGSGTGSTQPREYNSGAIWKKQ
jgi:hypothetical protein